MIEYILARPFIALFVIFVFLFALIKSFFDQHHSYIAITLITVAVFLPLMLFLFVKSNYRIILLVILLVIGLKIILHLKEGHILNSFDPTYAKGNFLQVIQSIQNKSDLTIDAKLLFEKQQTLVRINIPAVNFSAPVYFGDTLLCQFDLIPVKPSSNRYFNTFNNYLLNQHIFYKAILTDSSVTVLKNSSFTVRAFSQKLSHQCKNIFLEYCSDKTTAHLVVALLLGDKSGLDKTIKNDFINTGTAHILAVSGLHLGMIYILLNSLIRFIRPKSYSKKTKYLEVILLLLLIWLFAFISGLGTSVVRAAVMLTIFEAGLLLKRNPDAVNSLFACGFIMSFYNPCTLLDIGFQLSFMAVLSILLFNSLFVRIYSSTNYYLNKVRDLLAVTLSVQILVTPVSVFYFQQFPLYFILSNLVWVPLSFLLIITGILMIVFQFMIPALSICLGHISNRLCKIGLASFDIINKLPGTKMEGLWIYPEQVIIYTISVALIYFWLLLMNSRLLIASICLLLLIPVAQIIRMEIQKQNRELILYMEDGSMQFDIRTGMELHTSSVFSKTMKNYRSAHHIATTHDISQMDSIKAILTKNHVKLTGIVSNECIEAEAFEFPIKHPVKVIDMNSKNNKHSLTVEHLVYSGKPKCIFNTNAAKITLYELKADGPFILKF